MKFFNINVTEEEIDRKPDRVRLYDGESGKSIEYGLIRPEGDISVIEDIKDEIRQVACEHADVIWSMGLKYSLRIIDKHAADIKRG